MAKAAATGNQQQTHRRHSRLRKSVITLLVITGCLAFGIYVFVHWAERQILTTNNWVALVAPLPKQPVISTALGNTITDKVFNEAVIQQEVSDALPPRAVFFCKPLTSQLQTLTAKTAQKLVASDGFQTIWVVANRTAMNRIVTTARGQTPPLQAKLDQKFNIDLGDTRDKLRTALGQAGSAIPDLQPATQQALNISTDLRTTGDNIRRVVRSIDFLAAILPLLVAACLLWALALSRDRRKTTANIALAIIALMLLEMIVIKWLRQETLDQVRSPSNLSAVGYIYDGLVAWLKQMITVVIVAMLALIALLIAAGPAKWARSLRTSLHVDRLEQSQAMRLWRRARLWLRLRKSYALLVIAAVILVILALFVTVTTRSIVNAVLLVISLSAAVHILASQPKSRNV